MGQLRRISFRAPNCNLIQAQPIGKLTHRHLWQLTEAKQPWMLSYQLHTCATAQAIFVWRIYGGLQHKYDKCCTLFWHYKEIQGIHLERSFISAVQCTHIMYVKSVWVDCALVSLPVWYTAVCHWSAVYACPLKELNSSWLLSLSLYLEAIKVLLSEDWTDKERSVSEWDGKHFSYHHLNKDLRDMKCSGDFLNIGFQG